MTTLTTTTTALRSRLRSARVGLAVVVGALLLYLPLAGSYGLWDPWETHYAEVARQMSTRGDFISLWWPGSPRETPTFQTKPVLSFWVMSLSMRVAGLGRPGGAQDEMAIGSRAEWAVRTPFCLFGALGLWAIYFLTARLAGRRAGVLAAAVSATFPMYALVARQAMTDMIYVGLMSLALALMSVTLLPARPPAPPSNPRAARTASFATAGLLLLATVPQLLVDSIDLRVPVPWGGRTVTMYGIVAMAPYWLALAGALVFVLRTRHTGALALLAAATLAGLAVLAKGLAGLALPAVIVLAFLVVRGGWPVPPAHRRPLLLALGVALIVVAVVAVPWHHAMYIRHGAPWWNELFGDNHWRRLVIGRHGDRGTFSYFLRELGYGGVPVIALAAAALAHAIFARRAAGTPEQDRRRALLTFGTVWFVSAYFVVSMSMTKFHHYLLPALPGLAIVIACFLDERLEARDRWSPGLVVAAIAGLPLLAAVTHDLVATEDAAEKFLWLFSYDYVHSRAGRPWPPGLDFRAAVIGFAVALGLAVAAIALPRTRKLGIGALGVLAVAHTFFLLDHFMPTIARSWSQKTTIARYYQERRGPQERLVAYHVFWRGETFYTKNAIFEGPDAERTVFDHWSDTDERLKAWIAQHRGQRHFFLVEAAREPHLRRLLPAAATLRVVERSNNKFVLAVAEL